MTSQLVGTSFTEGLSAPHFVNGRLLTAEDLKAEQTATLQRLALVGQASGHGIVDGLMASQSGATGVQVTAGLGFNQLGQPVHLPTPVTLSLAPQGDPSQLLQDAGRFASCAFESSNGTGTTPSGAYLLTAVPASRLEGSAPVKSAAGSTSTPTCASRWEVEGVQFKTIPLSGFSLGEAPAQQRRNLLAHWCFGSLALQELALDPFTFSDRFTGLDGISAADLTACDLPLAVFHWTGSALSFVDAWAARRRLVAPLPSTSWRGSLSDKRVAEGQARFLQFQAHLDRLQSDGQTTIRSSDYFRFLPPVCFVPIRGGLLANFTAGLLLQRLIENVANISFPVATGQRTLRTWLIDIQGQVLGQLQANLPQTGFDRYQFLNEQPLGQVGLISRETVDFTLQHSWYDEAIDLDVNPDFDVLLVEDQWEGYLGERLGNIVEQRIQQLPGLTSSIRLSLIAAWRTVVADDLRATLGRDFSRIIQGNWNITGQQLYMILVKQRPRVRWVEPAVG